MHSPSSFMALVALAAAASAAVIPTSNTTTATTTMPTVAMAPVPLLWEPLAPHPTTTAAERLMRPSHPPITNTDARVMATAAPAPEKRGFLSDVVNQMFDDVVGSRHSTPTGDMATTTATAVSTGL